MPTNRPGFFAQYTEGQTVKQFVSDAAEDDRLGRVGACVLLSRQRASTHTKNYELLAQSADFMIADPETRRTHSPVDGRGRARADFRYLRTANPKANITRFTESCIDAQLEVGAGVVVSPSFIHGLGPGNSNLDATLQAASEASSIADENEVPLLVGLEATMEVVADETSCDRMIDHVVEAETGAPIYFRMTIDPPDSRRPFADHMAIAGLRRMTEAFVGNEIEVIFPQSGLVGWLMLACGASSYGAGTSASMERNLKPVPNSNGGGGRPPLHWYFCPDLLGPVLAEELPALYAAGVNACNCPYCTQSPPLPGVRFDRAAADLHYLWWCAKLANELRGQAGMDAVSLRLNAASVLWESVQQARVPLDSRSRPTHVEAWTQAMS